ncbi:glycosyltransferase [Rhizobacter fulvus]
MSQSIRAPTRISLFLPSLAGGGTERAFALIANGLAARGAEVYLVVAQAVGPILSSVSSDVRIVDLRQASIARALPALISHLQQVRPSALMAGMSHANVVAAIAHRVAGSRARLVLSEHAHMTSVFRQYRDIQTRLTRRLIRLTYPWADAVISVSEGVRADMHHHVKIADDRSMVIYNPVVDAALTVKAAMQPSHPWLVDLAVPVVLAAGRLTHQKDFSNLLEAFAVVRRLRTARLIILGEGELRMPLLQLGERLGIASDLNLPGFEPNPYSAMRAARVFVLSSAFEGMSYVLVEAMACGARVVSTDCPSGPREVLEGGRWGRLVPVNDHRALAAAICAALDDNDPPNVRVRAAEFSVDSAVAKYAGILGLPD